MPLPKQPASRACNVATSDSPIPGRGVWADGSDQPACWPLEGSVGELDGMFESFSTRARQLIFLARVESGARGAERIDVDDLVASLIMEDQGIPSQALLRLMSDPSQLPFEPHTAFLPSEVAVRVIEEIQDASPHRQSVPTAANMPMSPALG
jgi:hypothetical protein